MEQGTLEGFRLSPQQRRVWSLQNGQGSSPYRAYSTIHIEGDVDHDQLLTAVTDTIQRHEIFHTTYQQLSGMDMPLQVVSPQATISIDEKDLSQQTTEAQAASLAEWRNQQSPFDYENGPLLHACLVRLAPQQYQLLLHLPALATDSTSFANLVAEINQAYKKGTDTHDDDEEPMQYIDLSEWQNDLLEDEEAKEGRAYWQQRPLNGLTAQQLPSENKDVEAVTFTPHSCTANLPLSEITTATATLNSTLSHLLQACWHTLFFRLTQQPTITIGTHYNGRKYAELENAMGLFAKHLPIQSTPTYQTTLSDIITQLKTQNKTAHKWQEYFSWDLLDAAYLPICFTYQESAATHHSNGVTFALSHQTTYFDRFKINLHCLCQDSTLQLTLHYDQAYLTEAAAQQLLAQYQTLLTAAVANPTAPIGHYNILSQPEYQSLVEQFNKTQTEHPNTQHSVHDIIQEQAMQTPTATAVVADGTQLTYAQLNDQANQLAHHLLNIGLKPETPITFCLDRTVNTLIAILAILKAGGAYVPLDPILPTERLTFMLKDTQTPILITQQQYRAQFEKEATDQPLTIISIDTDWPQIAQQSTKPPTSQLSSPQNLAYIIYTSGSTGRPKGVAISHHALINYIYSIRDRIDLPPTAHFAQVSTFAADLGNTAVFPTLCTGGCLHIISADQAADPDQMQTYISENEIDCLKIVPSHLSALLTGTEPEKIIPAQRLIVGGEASSWKLGESIQMMAPECQLINHYGPTETTVGVLTYTFPLDQWQPLADNIPLGRPIGNTQVYCLDEALQPVPVGATGQLYIGGDALARGYWQRPSQTAQAFIPNPFLTNAQGQLTPHHPSRLYKTGDRARFLPDGNLEFLGRADHQIKIRGFRLELGEIEAILRTHPTINDAVVILREENNDNKRLVAYIACERSQAPTLKQLQRFLTARLPDYMIPNAFITLDTLPLTPNGKVDRKALPAPDQKKQQKQTAYIAPRTEEEEILTEIWSQVIGVPKVGIHDNFFQLGGDSILSIQVIAAASHYNLKFTPRQLFEHPTIAQLVLVANQASTQPVEPEYITGPAPLLPIQHNFFAQNLQNPHHYNQAALFEIVQPIDLTLFETVVQHVFQYHDALRLRFNRRQARWQQAHIPEAPPIPFDQIDLAATPDAEKTAVLHSTANQLHASLNITEGPLARVAIINLGPNHPTYLLILIHHLVVDGISFGILLEDITIGYQQLSDGHDIELIPKTTSYQTWSHHLMEHAQTKEVHQELTYWQAEPRQHIQPLPTDMPAANNTGPFTNITLSLTADETQALLKQLPTVYNTTITDALLTALLQTVNQWTEQKAILVSMEGHGREQIENVDLSRTVGWFTTRYPLLLQLDNQTDIGNTLRSVKEQIRAVPHKGIGYGLLRYLSADRQTIDSLKTLPQPQISFNYFSQLAPQGQYQSQSLKWVSTRIGDNRDPNNKRAYLLTINGDLSDDIMSITWTYSTNVYQDETVEQLANTYMTQLRALITYAQSSEEGGYTPSDFPKAKISQTDLDKLISKISQSDKTS